MSFRILSQRALRRSFTAVPVSRSAQLPVSRPAARLLSTTRPRRADDSTAKNAPETSTPDTLPHVSEEAAIIGKIEGSGGPDLGQGTPVQEVLERDEKAKENAPEIIKEEIKNSDNTTKLMASDYDILRARMEREVAEYALTQAETDTAPKHIFPLPESLPETGFNFKRRYDDIVDHFTNLIMKHGKKAEAQRNATFILNFLRSAPTPKYNPSRPLIPGAPPAPFLPLNPIAYLQTALDSLAPLLRLRSVKGQAGGGATLQIPTPISLRQRRRAAFNWIISTVEKKGSKGSGKNRFAQKVAEEIVAVIEGRSAAWDKRDQLHRMGTALRANINAPRRKR